MLKTQHEIIRQGYKALVDSLGVVDAIRFIQAATTSISVFMPPSSTSTVAKVGSSGILKVPAKA